MTRRIAVRGVVRYSGLDYLKNEESGRSMEPAQIGPWILALTVQPRLRR